MSQRLLALLLASLVWLAARAAWAQAPSYEIGVAGGPAQLSYVPGICEVYARVENPTSATLSGSLVVTPIYEERVLAKVAFSASPGGVALVRVPVDGEGVELNAQIRVGAAIVSSQNLLPLRRSALVVFDATEAGRLRGALANAGLPPSLPARGGAQPDTKVEVATPTFDGATGAPILPTYVASWHGVALVHMSTATLVSLPPEELEALAGHVLGGATLALVVTRPEDLRHPALTLLAGDEPRVAPYSDEQGKPFELSSPLPRDPEATPEGIERVAYAGGNLRPNVFGGSASYGLGEVVLLGFDTGEPTVASAPWTRAALLELARAAWLRAGVGAVRPGNAVSRFAGPPQAYQTEPVARLLDPGVGVQWGIGVASLFLCAYAVLSGPISFQRAKKAGRPLRALLLLPLLSAGAFLLIVLFGFVAKGVSVRAREVVFVDAGAGMSVGAARRHRGFFSPFSQTLAIRPHARTHTLGTWQDAESAISIVDGDGLRVEGVEAPPSETVTFHEDGLFAIGGGVSIVRDGADLLVENRTPWELRALVLRAEVGEMRYLPRLAPGATARSSEMVKSYELDQLEQRHAMSRAEPLATGHELANVLNERGEGELAQIWPALAQLVQESSGGGPPDTLPTVQWFPSSAPVLLALAVEEGGRDSGVPRDRAYIALRVVGLGAAR